MRVQGQILTSRGFVAGTLRFGTRIEAIEPGAGGERYVLPGFIDTHVHGGAGGDTMDGPDGVAALARFHARHGTTSLLPTTMTAPWPEVLRALRGVAHTRTRGVPQGASVIGAHLEGPFISGQRLGAQPPHHIDPAPDLVDEVLALDVVRAVTLAPELPGAADAAERFARRGVRVGLGHTAGTYEDALHVIGRVRRAGGRVAGTHLYNAMGALAGREPGVLGALLAQPDVHAELILDFHHVHAGAFLAARAALGARLMLVTDAMRAAGQGDGVSELGGQTVHVERGRARLDSGALAGSVLTLDRALRHAVECGVPLDEAAHMLSAAPARSLGLDDRGALAPGRRGDVTVLDSALHVVGVWVEGEQVQGHGA